MGAAEYWLRHTRGVRLRRWACFVSSLRLGIVDPVGEANSQAAGNTCKTGPAVAVSDDVQVGWNIGEARQKVPTNNPHSNLDRFLVESLFEIGLFCAAYFVAPCC